MLARQQVPLPVLTRARGHRGVGTKIDVVAALGSPALHTELSSMPSDILLAVGRGLEIAAHDVVNHRTGPFFKEWR